MKSSNFAVGETRRDARRRDATRLVTIRVNCPAVAAPTPGPSDVVMHSQAAHDGADVVAYVVLLHSRLARTWGCCNYSLQFRVPPECHGDAPAMPSKRPMHSARSLCTSSSPLLLAARTRLATTLRRIRASFWLFVARYQNEPILLIQQ